MAPQQDRLYIGEFAELVGLSVPQLRRCDSLRLLPPAGRSASGYRYYDRSQTGAARVIALLRSMDMPLADVREIIRGVDDDERRTLLANHRARLKARLDEVRGLLDAVDEMTGEDAVGVDSETGLTSWLHLMPQLAVSDMDR